ncbi:MAG: tripartite tricarboxylate transporter TctB family protein [Granulosicoccus sp.]
MQIKPVLKERVLVQVALLFIAAALFATTFTQTFTPIDLGQSPMFFPRIILILWMGLAIIGLVQSLRQNIDTTPVASWLRIGIILSASLIYTNTIATEGFFLPSVCFALVCLPTFGIRNPLTVALFALAVPGALVLLFNHTLGMPLPTSRFTHLF